MFTDEQIAQLKALLKAEIDPFHERLDAQREHTEGLSQQIESLRSDLSERISGVEHSVKDIAEILRDPIFSKLDNHEIRLEALETEVSPKPSRH